MADAVVKRVPALVAGADAAALTVRVGRGRRTTIASSDDAAAAADALQDSLGQGPSLDVAADAPCIRSGALGDDPRWPRWGRRAAERGQQSSLTLRLSSAGHSCGTLTLYGAAPGCFHDRETIDVARACAVHAVVAILACRTASDLRTALRTRHVIGIAQGVAMERYGLDEDRSFALLRRISSQTETKLRDVATSFVASGRLPSCDEAG